VSLQLAQEDPRTEFLNLVKVTAVSSREGWVGRSSLKAIRLHANIAVPYATRKQKTKPNQTKPNALLLFGFYNVLQGPVVFVQVYTTQTDNRAGTCRALVTYY